MSTLVRLDEEWHEDVPIARIDGEIDASNAEEVGRRLRTLLTNHSVGLVVDLSATTYVDSAAINLLYALGAEMRGRQQRLSLVVAEGSPIARIVSIAGVDRAVPVRPTVAEAIDAAREEHGSADAAPGTLATPD